jgi:potassium/hydrogen antiporter
VSLLVQGTTIGWMARRLGVALPEPGDEQAVRAVFRDFELDPQATLASVCEFYDLPPPADAALALGDWITAALRRPPVAGDTVRLGPAIFVVRELQGGIVSRIGLGLQQ